MKKKIIIGVFSLLILITAIFFIVGAIGSYNREVASEDILEGFGAAMMLTVGGFSVFYELDLFYTVYCVFITPKDTVKSIFNVLSNISLLLVLFTDYIAYFLYKHVSDFFGEEIIVLFALLLIYIALRIACAVIPIRKDTV